MDVKKTGNIILILSIIGLAAMLLSTTILASVISEEEDTYEVGGGVKECGTYYSGYTSEYEDFADFCETQGYDCEVTTREGSMGTIYEVSCNDLCYECVNGETKTKLASPNCEEEGFESISDEDSIEYFQAWSESEMEDAVAGYCEELVETTCYQCEGGDVVDKVVEGETCPSGWTTDWDSLDCEEEEEDVPTVRCYKCDDSGNVISDTFEEQCDSGWSRTEPDCVQTVECYQCQEGEIVSTTFEGECAEGWLEEQPSSCEQEEMVSCYACQNGEMIENEFPESCPEEWSSEPVDCKAFEVVVGNLYDFEDNTATAVFSTLFSVGILTGIVMMTTGGKGKSNKRKRL